MINTNFYPGHYQSANRNLEVGKRYNTKSNTAFVNNVLVPKNEQNVIQIYSNPLYLGAVQKTANINFGGVFELKDMVSMPCPYCGITMTTASELGNDKHTGYLPMRVGRLKGKELIEKLEYYKNRFDGIDLNIVNQIIRQAEISPQRQPVELCYEIYRRNLASVIEKQESKFNLIKAILVHENPNVQFQILEILKKHTDRGMLTIDRAEIIEEFRLIKEEGNIIKSLSLSEMGEYKDLADYLISKFPDQGEKALAFLHKRSLKRHVAADSRVAAEAVTLFKNYGKTLPSPQILDRVSDIIRQTPSFSDDYMKYLHKLINGNSADMIKELLKHSQTTSDHVKPLHGAGEDSFRNLLVVCNRCNKDKNSTPFKEYIEKRPMVKARIHNYFTVLSDVIRKRCESIANDSYYQQFDVIPKSKPGTRNYNKQVKTMISSGLNIAEYENYLNCTLNYLTNIKKALAIESDGLIQIDTDEIDNYIATRLAQNNYKGRKL